MLIGNTVKINSMKSKNRITCVPGIGERNGGRRGPIFQSIIRKTEKLYYHLHQTITEPKRTNNKQKQSFVTLLEGSCN